jgi:hypothetical protein
MSLSHHHQRQLYRIESGLLGADPQLAEMLGISGKELGDPAFRSRSATAARPGQRARSAVMVGNSAACRLLICVPNWRFCVRLAGR